MRQTISRICGFFSAVLLLAIGILGLVPIWPWWVWITLGIAGLLFILGEFIWQRRDADRRDPSGQSQTGGADSQNLQAGRDDPDDRVLAPDHGRHHDQPS